MKKINLIFVISLFFGLFSCKKENKQPSELEILRTSNNNKSYPAVKMDSSQAITSITKQKVQELIDLSSLYMEGNQNTQIDSAIYKQILYYFYKPDSLSSKKLFEDLKNHKVKSAKVKNLEILQNISQKDTTNIALFDVEYYSDKKKFIGSFKRQVEYILINPNKNNPNDKNKEFQFFFLNFYCETDSTQTAKKP